ncbi:ring-cleaving dioxygenase [Paenibacillus senegalensis]|uniref:ring-cleaving dioxygenase n=1 Tax=Paenibacillus senegalensis TaxID=1465766 RepID=UPI00028856B5|nr:ring-cleaving dioxygenase [Paenibacillus senegalensis]
MNVTGIHHLSAMTANAKGNYDFYTKVLGLRLVKKTVNQDDTSVYHLFYGDEKGNPGTELTFFDIPRAARTYEGVNSISATSLRVADDEALRYWENRLNEHGVDAEPIREFAGRNVILFRDPEGQRLVLVSDEHNEGVPGGKPWAQSPVPVEYGILGLGPVKLTVRNAEPTVKTLELLGFREKNRIAPLKEGQPDIIVMETGAGGSGAEVHVEPRRDLPMERLGKGGVHHVAFRVNNLEELHAWIDQVNQERIANSGFVERFYFRSLYFREPNGILFELATDGPGFATDEPLETLGESLSLPPYLEHLREKIESTLAPLDTTITRKEGETS